MRIIFDIIMFVSVLFTPLWLVVMLSAVGMYFIKKWYEVIAIFVLFEFLFRAPLSDSMATRSEVIPLALYALGALVFVEWFRVRIRERAL